MKVKIKIPKPAGQKWTAKGTTMDLLLKSLNKHKWWGRYRSNHAYSGKIKNGVVTEITLKAKPVIIMPVWQTYGKASKAQKQSWDTMWKALKAHEENHHKLFEKQAAAWKKSMEAAGDPDARKMKAEWTAFNTALQAAQDAYDKKSGHGKKEGVILDIV